MKRKRAGHLFRKNNVAYKGRFKIKNVARKRIFKKRAARRGKLSKKYPNIIESADVCQEIGKYVRPESIEEYDLLTNGQNILTFANHILRPRRGKPGEATSLETPQR